jgi:ubiquinone/menaquinone biosynthesis C-methylase UbiE
MNLMNHAPTMPIVVDELKLLQSLVPLRDLEIIELGCGAAELARRLVADCPGCSVVALEVDERQHAKNAAQPAPSISFARGAAQEIPLEAARFDLALMLKSLHHVPPPQMDQALREVWRVLKPGGLLYVSEPVFAGDLNEVIRLFHDEQEVRRAATLAIQRGIESGGWEAVSETFFDMPVVFRDFAEFEQRIVNVTFADHRLGASTRDQVRQRFEPHMGNTGAHFLRPMRVNLLRKRG